MHYPPMFHKEYGHNWTRLQKVMWENASTSENRCQRGTIKLPAGIFFPWDLGAIIVYLP